MRKLVTLLILSFLSTPAFAGFGEDKNDFFPDEFTIKSYIRAHEKVLADKVERYNKEGLTWLLQGINKQKDLDLIKSQIAHTRSKRLMPIRVRDHHYVMQAGRIKLSFSASDLLLDRIYINGRTFKLDKQESLPNFQKRLLSFIKKPTKKRTSFLDFFISSANAYFYDISRVESLIVLNASGVISVTYNEPWFWEVGEYSVNLANAFTDQLNKAHSECRTKSQEVSKYSSRRIGADFQKILDSMKTSGRVDKAKLISSLLKKFSKKNAIDEESEGKVGSYKPLSGKCEKIDENNPGLIQQMFPISPSAPTLTGASYGTWVRATSDVGGMPDAREGVCDALEKTVLCLENLETIQAKNVRDSLDSPVKLTRDVNLDSGTVFEEVNGSHSSK